MSDDDLQPGDYLTCDCGTRVTKDDRIRGKAESDPTRYKYSCDGCYRVHLACPVCMNLGGFITDKKGQRSCYLCTKQDI